MRMQRRRKKGQTEAASAPPLQAQFQSRPFQDANTLTNQQAAPPEMQLQPEQQGFDFASIPLFANSATSSQPIQRQEEDNDLQMKPEPDAIQRMGKDDDEMQMKPEPDAIQRMGKDDDEMQMKPESNGSINPLLKNLVQRDDLETPVPRIPIQAQLSIGAPGDKYEQEADHVAHNVVEQINAPAPNATQSDTSVQREMVAEDDQMQMKPIVQRQELDGGVEAPTEVESSINQAKGGGQSLDAGLQRSMGQAMGSDFSGVKVHTDSQADTLNQSLQAKAFTTGQHVFFKKGEYQPSNKGGQELIAHELTHVVQQGGAGTNSPTAQPKRLENSEQSMHQSTIPVKQSSSPTIQRYFQWDGMGGMVKFSRNIVHEGGPKTAYATEKKLEESNTQLQESGSFITLEKGSKFTLGSGFKRRFNKDYKQKMNIEGKVPTFFKIVPRWVSRDDTGIHQPVQNKNEQQQPVQNKNEQQQDEKQSASLMQLWQDCRQSSAAVMGSTSVDREVEYHVNDAINRIKDSEPRALMDNLYTAMLPVFLTQYPDYAQDIHKQPDGQLKAVVAKKSEATAGSKKIRKTKIWCHDAYMALDDAGKDAFNEMIGADKFALPNVGQGYVIIPKGGVQGFEQHQGAAIQFPYHWGGVIMQDGNDRLTLEQASQGDPSIISQAWSMNFYGTEQGQSFQEKNSSDKYYGTLNTTLTVQNPHPDAKQLEEPKKKKKKAKFNLGIPPIPNNVPPLGGAPIANAAPVPNGIAPAPVPMAPAPIANDEKVAPPPAPILASNDKQED